MIGLFKSFRFVESKFSNSMQKMNEAKDAENSAGTATGSNNNPIDSDNTIDKCDDNSNNNCVNETISPDGDGVIIVKAESELKPSDSEHELGRSVSTSAVGKSSGLKPLSRIGRPCASLQQPKPALPATPTKNSSDDSTRRITDDLGRHHLTDLLEADESEEDGLDNLRTSSRRSKRCSSSIGSTASIDTLWDKYPRRLSEAGLSRHSDSSTILTEDTDGFMIGQRVWVGGTKPGKIAYIGETQFAPGEWAGIALDEPIGKNDGSVAGKRYFQCENKKGVFSRLTRLTHERIDGGDLSFSPSATPTNGVRRSPISPTGSTRSLLKSSASLSFSNTSLASTATNHPIDYKLGDRVIIKSQQGSKVGVVRYIGQTEFAPGDWVGVELDDPRGKNDGSVSGRRYFDCRPNFGLFAPISKVSKSPSKVKPGACVVHSSGLPSGLMKRSNSKESMTSMVSRTTSVASSKLGRVRPVGAITPKTSRPGLSTTPISSRSALQDVLKEKQQHIEQLMKERDLERAQITKAATQAETAEIRFIQLQNEFETYRNECETKLKENFTDFNELRTDRDETIKTLEDEKRKNEELLFKFEEADIIKQDLEAEKQTAQEKIKELVLISEKSATTEATLLTTQAELNALKKQIQDAESTRAQIELETERIKSEIVSTASSEKSNLEQQLAETTQSLNQARKEIDRLRLDYEAKLAELTAENAKRLAEIKHQTETIEKLGKDLEATRSDFQAQSADLQLRQTLQIEEHQTKNLLLAEDLQTRDLQINELNFLITQLESELSERKASIEQLHAELDAVRKSLETKSIESTTTITEKNVLTLENKELKSQLDLADQQIARLKSDKEEIGQLIDKLQTDLATKITNVEQLQAEIESMKKTLASKTKDLLAFTESLNQASVENRELSSQLERAHQHIGQLEESKRQIETELQAIIGEKSDDASESNRLRHELLAAQASREALQGEHAQKVGALETERLQLELNINQLQAAVIEVKSKHEQNLNDVTEQQLALHLAKVEQLKVEYKEQLEAAGKQRADLEASIKTLQAEITDVKATYALKLQAADESEAKLREIDANRLQAIEKQREEHQLQVDKLKSDLEHKSNFVDEIEERLKTTQVEDHTQIEQLKQQLVEKTKIEEEYNHLSCEMVALKEEMAKRDLELSEMGQQCELLISSQRETTSEVQVRFNTELKQLQDEIAAKEAGLKALQDEIVQLKLSSAQGDSTLETKTAEIARLTSEVDTSKIIVANLQNNIVELSKQHQVELAGLKTEIASLTAQSAAVTELDQQLKEEQNRHLEILTVLRHAAQNNLNNATHETNVMVIKQLCQEIIDHRGKVEQDKEKIALLERELVQAQRTIADSKSMPPPPSVAAKIEPESNGTSEGQISFLNSIIADIQKKNVEQKQRIELLESGYNPDLVSQIQNEQSSDWKYQREVAPRVFCDICDEFDLHETEECPLQNDDGSVEDHREKKTPPPERPYCESCEAFGHSTEDCEQTF